MKDAPNRWPLPPILTLGTILAAFALEALIPNPWDGGPSVYAAGLGLIAIAVGIDVWALLTFRKHRANIRPDRPATALIMDGPFSFSRNPIYLANVLLTAGLGFATDSRWHVFAAALLYIALQELAVKREEKHMEAHFGTAWLDYTKAVRRWI